MPKVLNCEFKWKIRFFFRLSEFVPNNSHSWQCILYYTSKIYIISFWNERFYAHRPKIKRRLCLIYGMWSECAGWMELCVYLMWTWYYYLRQRLFQIKYAAADYWVEIADGNRAERTIKPTERHPYRIVSTTTAATAEPPPSAEMLCSEVVRGNGWKTRSNAM